MVCGVLERGLGRPTRTLDGHQSLEAVTARALGELRGMEVETLRRLPGLKEGLSLG